MNYIYSKPMRKSGKFESIDVRLLYQSSHSNNIELFDECDNGLGADEEEK